MKLMQTFIQDLGITDNDKELLSEIFTRNEELGIQENSERTLILRSSMQYLGASYLRTEELAVSTIDCSTLTSQSYWEGAMVGIPFIADSQRSAADGEIILLKDAKPADIVVKYPSIAASPDHTYNHVGLILGQAKNGTTYVIESNSREGCVISTLEKFGPEGGFRRYLKNENVIVEPDLYDACRQTAKNVPKLSRLGARQYTNGSDERIPHKGLDIYLPVGSTIRSPIAGRLTQEFIEEEEKIICSTVRNPENDIVCVLGNVQAHTYLIDTDIQADEIIGEVTSLPDNTVIRYPNIKDKNTHVHFEISGDLENTGYKVNQMKSVGRTYYNGLYLAKTGIVKLPFLS